MEIPRRREMRSHGRKNVAAVEGGRDGRLDHPVLVGDFAGGIEAVALDDRGDEPVVGENKKLAFVGLYDDGFARRADAGIYDRGEDGARRIVRRDAGEKARAVFNGVRGDLMGDVHDAGVRSDIEHDRFANGHGVIGGAEVGHEDDGGARGGGRVYGSGGLRAGGAEKPENDQRKSETTKPKSHQLSVKNVRIYRDPVYAVYAAELRFGSVLRRTLTGIHPNGE